jgi:hypothetical protein
MQAYGYFFLFGVRALIVAGANEKSYGKIAFDFIWKSS